MRIADLPGWTDIRLGGHLIDREKRRECVLRCGGLYSVTLQAGGMPEAQAVASANAWAAALPLYTATQAYVDHGQIEGLIDALEADTTGVLSAPVVEGHTVLDLMIAELEAGL